MTKTCEENKTSFELRSLRTYKMNFNPFNLQQSEQTKICRCCLGKDGSRDISAEFHNFGQKEVYEEMLNDVFNIQAPQVLQVKHYICEDCIIRLRESSLFKQMVVRNQDMYVECLQNFLKEGAMNSELKHENIKEETANLDSFDDDVANDLILELKEESSENIEETVKSKSKMKLKEHQSTPKQTDHRGTGPILRENSLKILNNSTLTVFQWNKSSYTCFCCKEPFQDFEKLKKHTDNHKIHEIEKKIISQHNQPVKVEITRLSCKICNKEKTDLNNLIEHFSEHNIKVHEHLLIPFRIESKLKCQICSESFALFRLLNIHMNKHYQKYVCYVCGAGFSNLVFLNLHRSRLHRPIECQKCAVNFKSKSEKKSHDIEFHGIKFERKQRFPCKFCQQRFFQEDLKVKHLVEAHGVEKPEFSCQFCSKIFITKSLLNNHVKVVHMKERSHQCSVCSKVFYTKSDVLRHSVTHTGEKNFVCSVCSNLFASRDSLRRHIKRVHVGH